MSNFKSSPSCSTEFITPSPNFLWNTVTPALYLLKSIPLLSVLFLLSELKKLSAVLNSYTGFAGENLSLNAFVWYFLTVPPYSQSYTVSFCSYDLLFSSYPCTNSFGISSKNLDILLQEVEPNIVLCLAYVRYRYSSALVKPT